MVTPQFDEIPKPMTPDSASHQEIADLRLQLTAMSVKLDVLNGNINTVNVALAKQDGANIPAKIKDIEQSVKNLESVRDSRAWMPSALEKVQEDVQNLEYFKYKMIGIVAVVQLVVSALVTVGVKIAFDAIARSAMP